MQPGTKRFLSIALIALATAAPGLALAGGDVTVTLQAYRVIQKEGRETLEPGNQASPGEILEYRAICRNAGTSGVRSVAATLPIPKGMELMASTLQPRGALGSVDGKTFESLPLKRRVRLADGREVLRDVPAAEVRWVRWSIPTLDSGGERSVRARVRVTPVTVAADVRR